MFLKVSKIIFFSTRWLNMFLKRCPKSVFLHKVAKNVCRTKERRARRQAAKKVTPLKMLTAEKTACYKRAHQMLRGPWTAEASLYL